jgi:hypothetical protein
MALPDYELHIKAQANLVEKLAILHPRAMPNKPSIEIIYVHHDRPTYAWNIPHNLQLPFVFAQYNKIINANRTARKDAMQSSDVSRAIWYWGIDPTHSFFKDHESIRYNIILMTLVSMSTDPNKHTTPEAQKFAWAFIMAWVEQLDYEGKFSYRDHFIDMWKTGPYDLIVFTEEQKRRVKQAVAGLKEKMGKGSKQQALGKVSRVVAEEFEAFRGAEWALRWCFVHCNENPGTASLSGVDPMIEIDIDRDVLSRVDWNAPVLEGLLVDIDRHPDYAEGEVNLPWLGVERAMDLLEDECGDAADVVTQLFGRMGI